MKKLSKIILIVSCLCVGAFTTGVAFAEANEKGREDNAILSGADLIAPEITIDTKAFTLETAPNAVKDKSYALFSATAKDIYGKDVYVSTKLWMYYDSETRAMVSFTNNAFTPISYGVYTVEYTATDVRGNTTVVTYDFTCAEKNALAATFSSGETIATTGDVVSVSEVEFSYNIGEVDCEITATLQGNESIVYEVKNGEFIPLFAGTYDINYVFSDYNETGEKSYELTVSAAALPVAVDLPELPRYFLVGAVYQLPNLAVYDCSSGTPIPLETTVKATYGSTTPITVDETSFTPTTEGKLTINYEAKNANGTLSVPFTAQVVDVGYTEEIKMAKYFAVNGMTASANNAGISLSIKEDNASATFINAVLVNDLALDFLIDGEKNAFETMYITLTDSLDETQSVKFAFKKNTQISSLFSVNGGREVKTGANFYDGNTAYFSYDSKTKKAKLGNSDALLVETYENGNAFQGFSSGETYVTFTFEKVVGESMVLVTKLNNQSLYDTYGDGVAPSVIFENYAHGERKIGDTVSIPRIYVGDVLDPNVTVTYSIYAPDRTYVKDINGVILQAVDYTMDYSFVVEQLGTYSVSMRAEDSFGNYNVYSYGITVSDTQAPILVLSPGVEECNLGETVELKQAIIKDNFDEETSVFVIVMLPEGRTEEIKIDGSGAYIFTPKTLGKYEIWYYTVDTVGNVKMVSYTLTVKEA